MLNVKLRLLYLPLSCYYVPATRGKLFAMEVHSNGDVNDYEAESTVSASHYDITWGENTSLQKEFSQSESDVQNNKDNISTISTPRGESDSPSTITLNFTNTSLDPEADIELSTLESSALPSVASVKTPSAALIRSDSKVALIPRAIDAGSISFSELGSSESDSAEGKLLTKHTSSESQTVLLSSSRLSRLSLSLELLEHPERLGQLVLLMGVLVGWVVGGCWLLYGTVGLEYVIPSRAFHVQVEFLRDENTPERPRKRKESPQRDNDSVASTGMSTLLNLQH